MQLNKISEGTPIPSRNIDHEADAFVPKFDSLGLVAAIAQDSKTGDVLMLAFMDAEALRATRETGEAHFHSRSRDALWKKGETSGNVLQVDNILVDCDQDALILKVTPKGPACHTGRRSCFYRKLEKRDQVGFSSKLSNI